jgi:hypothetical protein
VITIAGANFFMNKLLGQLPINVNTIQPPLKKDPNTTFRILCSEARRPHDLPKDEIGNYSQVPLLSFVPMFIGRSLCGTGKVCNDRDTAELLNCDENDVTEVAGQAAYDAAGFTNTRIVP